MSQQRKLMILMRKIYKQIDFYYLLEYIPLILLFLAIYDLRIEIKILLDHFTFISLLYAIKNHPLAIFIIVFYPFILKKI